MLLHLIYLFMSRHEVHSMNTHSAERRSIKTDKIERSTRHWRRRNHRVTERHFLQLHWRQNHRLTNTFVSLLL